MRFVIAEESSSVVKTIIDSNIIISATKYLGEKLIIRAVRKRYKNLAGCKRFTKGNVEIVLTIGKPNYAERQFIKLAKKTGEPFPIKKIQLKLVKPMR